MDLPDATIDITILNKPIVESQWAQSVMGSEVEFNCDRETALSCIAYFETGQSDIAPENLKDVFAMSSGDSIYISEQLLCDPWEIIAGYKFRRALGNIGRTGVTMLIPPQNPMIRDIDPGSWKFINNANFNDLQEDHFERTSLHLSFTDFHRPLDLSLRGEQDIRVGLLECIISVHDAGKWVADVDILAAMGSSKIDRVSVSHATDDVCQEDHSKEVISLENWDEILDMPSAVSVVRAWGNPSARLAVASVLAQLQNVEPARRIRICPPKMKMCLFCFPKAVDSEDCVLIY